MAFLLKPRIDQIRQVASGCVIIVALIFSVAVAQPASAQDQPVALEVDSIYVGMEAKPFVMKKMGATVFEFLSNYSGELRVEARMRGNTPKAVVISFFATWCKPCPNEMAELTQIAKEYEGRDIVFFFVNFGQTDQQAAKWLTEHPDIQGTVLMDPFLANAKNYGAAILPRTVLIDKNRIIQFFEQGYNPEHYRTDIVAAIESVLNADEEGAGPP